RKRIYVYYIFSAFFFLVLIARLFQIQIVLGDRNRDIAEGNRIKKTIIPAPRGIIFDKAGRALIRNEPVYRLTGENDEKKIISRDEAILIEASEDQKENLSLDVGRFYIYKDVLAHVLGYIAEAGEDDLGEIYKTGDLLGRGGLEKEYDSLLRGKDGGDIIEVNAKGKKIAEIEKQEPQAGENLYLTIDAELSKVAFEALGESVGAVVATMVKTGEVLVLVSTPSFDPNLMSSIGLRESEKIEELLKDLQKPFFNRAISGLYPPGSTFKIISSVAGLQEGKINENTIIEDKGFIKVGDYLYKNWYFTQYGKIEGEVDVVKALARSVDTFYYKLGEWVGPDKLAFWAHEFGLGEKTQIELDSEVSGTVPTPSWKEEIQGERWFLGNTYHFVIGQGDLLTTPIQINQMTQAIANNGHWCKPFLVKGDKSNCRSLNLSPQTIKIVQEGLRRVCEKGGTAFEFFEFSPQVAGKTGTAEFGNSDKTHAWFTGYAPADPSAGGPEIVVTALVEEGGEGSYIAAPIVKRVIEKWFEEK
ncbi:hypothetical protein KKF11_01875, partial [Patescibacteria group bacterium]|nr:hypothetical protein [Patescibacteria group bacterium]